jgi:ribulose-5-phosphate 4-epimerase/fuculose-1-phosphate aldolase
MDARMNRRMIFHRLLPALAALASLFVAAAPAHAQANRLPGVAAAAVRLGVDPQVIEDLVTANRILAHEGVLDAYGHVSMRDPTRPDRFLIARPVAADLVTANDIIEYDLDSNPISPTAAQFIEIFIHGEIYKARPDVQAVVHTHSAALIPFSVSTVPLRPVFHMAAFIAFGVPVWDPAETTDPDAAGMLVRNRALGASLAATLGEKPVVLLRGHGAVIVSRDLRSAVRNSIFLVLNARMQEEAIALGGPVKYITVEEAKTMFGSRGDTDRAWDYWKRRAFGSK